jgi:hypothetical protein
MSFIKNLGPRSLLNDAKQLGKSALGAIKHEAGEVIASAAKPGTPLNSALNKVLPEKYVAHPEMPTYTRLSAAQLSAAKLRSGDLTRPLDVVRDPGGKMHEPLCIEVSGTKSQLQRALQKGGWVKAEDTTRASQLRTDLSLAIAGTGLSKYIDFNEQNSPVSPMLVNGKPQTMSFEKNNDHHQCRDHLRIYSTGKTDAQGRPIWEIAATRDVQYTLNLRSFKASHQIDPAIDQERDMVMADLLGTGQVDDWSVARGQPTAQVAAHLKQAYQTDNNVYLVSLK